MFGNLTGWIIAAVILLLIGFGVWQVTQVNQLTPATKFSKDKAIYEPLSISVPPTSVVPMNTPGDASEQYRTAIEDVRRNASKYQDAIASNDVARIKALPAVKAAVAATPLNSAKLLERRADENVGYSTQDSPDMQALLTIGKCLELAGLFSLENNPKEARRHFEAQFALGARMFNERINYWEAFFGIGQMRTAADGMKLVAEKQGDTAEVEKLTAFNDAAGTLVNKGGTMERMWRVLSAVDKKVINTHAGDIHAFTGPEMKERLWRIESILKLGRHKYNVARLADQTAVPHRLAELRAKESDPAVKAAIDKADQLTLQDYRMIR